MSDKKNLVKIWRDLSRNFGIIPRPSVVGAIFGALFTRKNHTGIFFYFAVYLRKVINILFAFQLPISKNIPIHIVIRNIKKRALRCCCLGFKIIYNSF